MKKYLLISLAVLSSMPLMANSEFEIQSIKTVEDVQMVRNRLIDRMTEILETEVNYRGFTPSLYVSWSKAFDVFYLR